MYDFLDYFFSLVFSSDVILLSSNFFKLFFTLLERDFSTFIFHLVISVFTSWIHIFVYFNQHIHTVVKHLLKNFSFTALSQFPLGSCFSACLDLSLMLAAVLRDLALPGLVAGVWGRHSKTDGRLARVRLVHRRLSTVMEWPRHMSIPRDFTPGLLVSPDGNCKSTPGKGSAYPVLAVLQTERGGGLESTALHRLLCLVPQTHSLLCLESASVELLFICPRDYTSGLFEDQVVANLEAWSAIWGLLPLFYLLIYWNELIQVTFNTNNLLFKPFERKLLIWCLFWIL